MIPDKKIFCERQLYKAGKENVQALHKSPKYLAGLQIYTIERNMSIAISFQNDRNFI